MSMSRHPQFALTLLALMTACASTPATGPAADVPYGITLSAVETPAVQNLAAQALSDVQAAILVGKTNKADTAQYVLNIPGSTGYSITSPAFATFSPASGTLSAGQATLTASFICPKDAQTFLGNLTVQTTNVSQTSTIPVVLVCNKNSSPQPYLFKSAVEVEPGGSVSSASVTLAGLNPGKGGTLTTQGGTAVVNGAPIANAGFTVNNGDLLALRVQASSLGNTTVAAVTQVEPYTAIFLVATRGVISVSPTSLDFLNAVTPQTLTIRRSNNLAVPTTGGCVGVVSLTSGVTTATSSSYTVQPVAAGSCTLTFTSGAVHTDVPITVTTTSVTAR